MLASRDRQRQWSHCRVTLRRITSPSGAELPICAGQWVTAGTLIGVMIRRPFVVSAPPVG